MELQFSMDFLCSLFWGVWKEGAALEIQTQHWGWLQSGTSAGVWWDLEQLIFQFSILIIDLPSTLLVCLVECGHKVYFFFASFQCKTPQCCASIPKKEKQVDKGKKKVKKAKSKP